MREPVEVVYEGDRYFCSVRVVYADPLIDVMRLKPLLERYAREVESPANVLADIADEIERQLWERGVEADIEIVEEEAPQKITYGPTIRMVTYIWDVDFVDKKTGRVYLTIRVAETVYG